MEQKDCLFCKIAAGDIPSEFLYQDDDIVCFRDIDPQAPVHLLVIPRKHISSLALLDDADLPLIGATVNVANQMARSEGISERGYRLAINCGAQGGQLIPHLHMHLLGGRDLSGMLG